MRVGGVSISIPVLFLVLLFCSVFSVHLCLRCWVGLNLFFFEMGLVGRGGGRGRVGGGGGGGVGGFGGGVSSLPLFCSLQSLAYFSLHYSRLKLTFPIV